MRLRDRANMGLPRDREDARIGRPTSKLARCAPVLARNAPTLAVSSPVVAFGGYLLGCWWCLVPGKAWWGRQALS
jgi:hypothetical protein